MQQERLGKYQLLERLGQGGMGEVWKARDTELQRFVAIKLLHADLQSQPDFVERFTREARFVASLHHPNIVQIHNFEFTSASGSRVRAYMVMDYIEGGTLADYIRSTVSKGFYPPAAEIVELFSSISLALDYAHHQGMIHRDIKPANILLDKVDAGKPLGEPILTDFGIARLQNAGASTLSFALVGTPRYISPEQAEGKTIDERSDLYSLGIILYEMLTGAPPFRGDSPIALMMKHVHEQPESPSLINPRVSPALAAVVLRSIAKDPQDRFASATAMTVELARALNTPLPASLSSTRSIGERSANNPLNPINPLNPLQPSRTPAGINPLPATLFASPLAPTSATMLSSPAPSALPPLLPTPKQQTRLPGTRRRWLLIAALACVLLALFGVSAFAIFPRLFSANTKTTPTATTSGGVFGHITFVASSTGSPTSTAPPTLYDQLRIDLNNIQPPPASTNYYAWLGNSNSEKLLQQRWLLQVSGRSIQQLNSSSPPHTDLFSNSIWFVITEETANSTPDIPAPNPANHIYYALISHSSTSSPTFEVRQCPSGSAANALSPCR